MLNQKTLSEIDAYNMCYLSWHGLTPLFHYSESIIGEKNPRAHSDYATNLPNTYNKSVDIDWELKGKDLAILKSFKS
jgi:UV DNA damage repair endonuclease